MIDDVFERFWATGATAAADAILATDLPFDAVAERLAHGPHHRAAATGELVWNTAGELHPTRVVVPSSYDPARRYPVRVFLHSALSLAPDDPARPRPLEFGDAYIAVYPTGSRALPWWSWGQVQNLRAILLRLRREYNIDDDRVQHVGVSDGATAAWFLGMKDATPWSSFVALVGSPRVLAKPVPRSEGDLFASNFTNRPLYVINGELDPLYRASSVAPYIRLLERRGAPVTFRALAGERHGTAWWSREREVIDRFEQAHRRVALPDAVSWQTDNPERYGRMAWLAIDALDPACAVPEPDLIDVDEPRDIGVRISRRREGGRRIVAVDLGSPAAAAGLLAGDLIVRAGGRRIDCADDLADVLDEWPVETAIVVDVERDGHPLAVPVAFPKDEIAFARARPAGRVDVVRDGNTFIATTTGVAAFTLLLSPAMIDYARPVAVVVDGMRAVAQLQPSIATLLRHAARDRDRSMLFASELRVSVVGGSCPRLHVAW